MGKHEVNDHCAGCGGKVEKYMAGNICEKCFANVLQDKELTPDGMQTRYNWF